MIKTCWICGAAFEGGPDVNVCEACRGRLPGPKLCRICGNPIPTASRKLYYCSEACAKKARKLNVRRYWVNSDPDAIVKRAVARTMEDPERAAVKIERERLKSAEFRRKKQKSMSPEQLAEYMEKRRIYNREYKRKQRERFKSNLPPEPRTCVMCGKPLAGKARKYCPDCKPYMDLASVRAARHCVICGSPINGRALRYCSDACRAVGHVKSMYLSSIKRIAREDEGGST